MDNFKTDIENVSRAERLFARKERKLKFSNLTTKQKNIMKAASVGGAGISFGVVAATLMGTPEYVAGEEITAPDSEPMPEACEEIEVDVEADAPFSNHVNDSMSFDEAFRTARVELGAGGIFEWRGNIYNTFIKEEWDEMSAQDKADFFNSIDKNFIPGDENREEELLNVLNDVDAYEDIDIVIIDDEDNYEVGEIVLDSADAGSLDDDDFIVIEDDIEDEAWVDHGSGDEGDDLSDDIIIVEDV
ncbi:MAG: hypothetical protein LC107_08595 [Chitinophagales bacterium]|nr:hypothetical protein [Chitinophagales bacterium]